MAQCKCCGTRTGLDAGLTGLCTECAGGRPPDKSAEQHNLFRKPTPAETEEAADDVARQEEREAIEAERIKEGPA